jgi:hypothetical protein
MKRTQNLVAESRFTLPVVMAYAIAIWLASGVLIPSVPITFAELTRGAWGQFVCFLVSAHLLAELNNSNALLRIYSRTVSSSFVVLLCAGSFLFKPMGGSIVQLCIIVFFLMFFRAYQDKRSTGWTFYAFLFIGLSSAIFIQVLFFVPFLWAMMFYLLTSLSWRTFFASIIGLLTPYWFALPVFLFQGNFDVLQAHVLGIFDFPLPDYAQLTVNQVLLFVLVVALGITGTVHYLRRQTADSVRVRLLFRILIYMWAISAVFLLLQPQHYDALIRILIISMSPLIAHYLSLTHTRITNISFFVICTVCVLLALLNLWMPSLSF